MLSLSIHSGRSERKTRKKDKNGKNHTRILIFMRLEWNVMYVRINEQSNKLLWMHTRERELDQKLWIIWLNVIRILLYSSGGSEGISGVGGKLYVCKSRGTDCIRYMSVRYQYLKFHIWCLSRRWFWYDTSRFQVQW